MLKHQLIHPRINEVLGRAGHHAKILIADGNYPASTKKGPNADVVCLNLSPGIVTVAQVLRAVLSAIPIDHVHTMGIPADDPYAKHGEPPVWKEFRQIIREAGLNVETAVKRGIYTIKQTLVRQRLGKLADADAEQLEKSLGDWLDLR